MTALAMTFDVGLCSTANASHAPIVIWCKTCRFTLFTMDAVRDEGKVSEHFLSTGHVDFSVERADGTIIEKAEAFE